MSHAASCPQWSDEHFIKSCLLGHESSTLEAWTNILWKQQFGAVKDIHQHRELCLNLWTELLLQTGHNPLCITDRHVKNAAVEQFTACVCQHTTVTTETFYILKRMHFNNLAQSSYQIRPSSACCPTDINIRLKALQWLETISELLAYATLLTCSLSMMLL